MSTYRRILLAATTLLLSSALVVAAPAHGEGLGAAEDLRYKKSSTTIPGGSAHDSTEAELYTYCDKGWRAVAGGQTVRSRAQHHISSTAPTGLRYWYGGGWQAHQAASTLTQYSVCRRTDDLTLGAASEHHLAADSQVTDEVPCTQGYPISGGFTAVGTLADFTLNANYPVDDSSDADLVPDDGWRTYVQYSGEGDDSAIFHGLCAGGPRPAYRTATVTVPAFSTVKTQALCPKRRPVTGGGVYVSGLADKSHVVASRPWDGSDTGTVPEDGWLGAIVNTSDGPLTMTVHAICR